jgi:peroxiredoxin
MTSPIRFYVVILFLASATSTCSSGSSNNTQPVEDILVADGSATELSIPEIIPETSSEDLSIDLGPDLTDIVLPDDTAEPDLLPETIAETEVEVEAEVIVEFPLQTGDKVPDFTLSGHNESTFTLSEQTGKVVLLSFFTKAFDPVSQTQMENIDLAWDEIVAINGIAFGISTEQPSQLVTWSQILMLQNLVLLSDNNPAGAVADMFGLFNSFAGYTTRANVVIRPNGKIIFMKQYELNEQPDLQEVLEAMSWQ